MKDKHFYITVKDKQNDTYQGTVEFIDHKEIIEFRSALELFQILQIKIGEDDE